MLIKTAEFKISNSDVTKCPATNFPEYAFIGRSNVGKSSLINMLTGRKSLAKTSSTPGKTLLINHFLINNSWYIVDLPGYGYAARSKSSRAEIDKMIKSYILTRQEMTSLFVLIDSRHEPQKVDMEFIHWLGENGVPFAIVFTKLDKLGVNVAKQKIELYKQHLLEEWEELPPIFYTSSVDNRGKVELLDYIDSINEQLKEK
ncbi:MAG: YihA family ribosome biogenesis GTP-binding protein [Muribaculaceae bacterium]|nr:YihA family ribosome biogenesis GTP-binding protein [Muribaculaceae bacterium]